MILLDFKILEGSFCNCDIFIYLVVKTLSTSFNKVGYFCIFSTPTLPHSITDKKLPLSALSLVINKGIYFSYPCRRHSCSLVNIPAPCVNKMISHIEDVESKIDGRLKQVSDIENANAVTNAIKAYKGTLVEEA